MASANVLALQKVLAAYSQASKNPAIHPGSIDGVVGDRTIAAVIVVAPQVPGIPSSIKTAISLLPIGMALPDGRKKAISLITNNASYIAQAVAATAIYRTIQGGGGALPPTINPILVTAVPPPYIAPPSVGSWAKTPVGIAVIAGSVLAAVGLTALVVRSFRN